MDLTFETIEKLADMATDKNLSELTVEESNQRVTIKTTVGTVVAAAPAVAAPMAPEAAPAPVAPETPAEAPSSGSSNGYYQVTSPMVGTYYEAASPDSAPFVGPGTKVSSGQTLCIIEAMKLMNELESEVSGTVKNILVKNAEPVEFGQVIMEIEVD